MKTRKPASCTILRLETLEVRDNPTVSAISLNQLTGLLTIQANDLPTTVRVEYIRTGVAPAQIDQIRVTEGANTVRGTYLASRVNKISFNGSLGNDSFNATGIRVRIQAIGNDGNDRLIGGSGPNTIDGGNGNDTIQAVGAGFFYGQSGDDSITTGSGDDTVDGGNGNDTINTQGGLDNIAGGAGNDTIQAGDGNDQIFGEDGIDSIAGGNGNDLINGGTGNDGLNGGNGNDSIFGGEGDDAINGEAGSDALLGGNGNDIIVGMAGLDSINGEAGNDFITGGPDADTIHGGSGTDTIQGNDGDDIITGDSDNDNIRGGNGNDLVEGNNGDDSLYGDAGNDVIRAQNGNDFVDGGDGLDFILGGDGIDSLHGGNGNDTINGNGAIDDLFGDGGDDWLVAIDAASFDSMTGGTGRDIFWRDPPVGDISGDILVDLTAVDADQGVAQFTNPGADRTLNGDAIPGPAFTAGLATRSFADKPLFSSMGPKATDINQGVVSDCKVVSALAALARNTGPGNSWAIRKNMVDFGDGTYGLKLGNNFYRVDAILPLKAGSTVQPNYANLGFENSIWVAIAEKGIAMADQRVAGAPNYGDLASTGADEVLQFFGSTQTGVPFLRGGYATMAALGADILQRFSGANPQYLTVSLSDSFDEIPANAATGQRRVIGTLGRKFVTNHAYTVWSTITDANGSLTGLILRNPWGTDTGNFGVSYSDANPNDGLVQITLAELRTSKGRLNWGSRVI